MAVDHDKIISLINDGNIEMAKLYVAKDMNDNYVDLASQAFKKFVRGEHITKSETYYDYVDESRVLFGDNHSIFILNSDEIIDEYYIKRLNFRKYDRPRVENRFEIMDHASGRAVISIPYFDKESISKYIKNKEQLKIMLHYCKLYLNYVNIFLGEDIRYYLSPNGAFCIAKSNKGEALVLGLKK